ncbi:MAG: glycosyltransferase family 2 protein [Novosphingobium sp.]|nr:glycosyltransferase family 2 protein [Novosphingobium sp.]
MTLDCLRSVYAQTTWTPFEVIVVDNGSGDGSAEAIAREFPQVRLMAEAVNHGFARATNLQARAARAEKLLLLNTDTVVLDHAIDNLVAFSREHPEARIWGGRTLYADGSLNPTSCWGKMTFWTSFTFATGLSAAFPNSRLFNPRAYPGWRRDSIRRVDIVTGCLFLIDRDFWRELGGFDRRFFMFGEEADLCMRAAKKGARPMITPAATVIHYDGGSTRSRAGKLIHTLSSTIGMIDDHFPPLGRGPSRHMIAAAAGIRALAYGLAAKLNRERFGDAAATWTEVWKRRREWRNGPIEAELG